MATIPVSAGSHCAAELEALRAAADETLASILRLNSWLKTNDCRGYDPFDGLNAKWVRRLTFERPLLRTVLQQGVRRFPLNLRPLLGISRERSTKGMGFLARGYIRLHRATSEPAWSAKAEAALKWLMEHRAPGYSGACWANHFDYQSRTFFLPKGVPTVVWTALIGHAFLDAYDHFEKEEYLVAASSACEHIMRDLAVIPHRAGACISYIPGQNTEVHNANTLGASLLARTYRQTSKQAYAELAQRAIRYTAECQRPDGSWYYGEKPNLHWVDNFHTAYVLDCFKHYAEGTGDTTFNPNVSNGYAYWKNTFFESNGTPRYYHDRMRPIDIQCCSQAIDTLVFFSDRDPKALQLAVKIARWTIAHMQNATGYLYYRRYPGWVVNRTPTLHWGQATTLCALAGLYRLLRSSEQEP